MKCNDIDKAQEIFSTTTNKAIVMYNTMLEGHMNYSSSDKIILSRFVLGLGENNRAKEAFKIFEEMSLPSNAYTYSILFKICAQSSDHQSFEFGQSVWKKISINDRKNLVVSTSFLQMLLKHEHISTCEQFFSQMKKNNITYATMMTGQDIHFHFLNSNRIFSSRLPFTSDATKSY